MANPTTPMRPTGTNPVTEKDRETASSMTEKAKEMASSVTHAAGDVASNVGQKAENATSAVGSRMRSLAGGLRERLPHEGMMGTASSAVADTLDRGGRYLQEEGLQGIGKDLTNLIRRHPIQALLLGIGVGYLIARSTRR